jgi:hypothetical protein
LAITASAGNVVAEIQPRRPSWADMHKHYPAKEVDINTLFNTMIGGTFTNMQNAKWLVNTCAVRMSYALLRSGFHLAQTSEEKAGMLGGDKKWYWLRVANLRAELFSRFKGFDAELKLKLINPSLIDDAEVVRPLFYARKAMAQEFLKNKLGGKNGIIVFGVKGWPNATGHFTLWDGTAMNIAYGTGHDDPESNRYYPWLTNVEVDVDTKVRTLVQVEQIQFWELK